MAGTHRKAWESPGGGRQLGGWRLPPAAAQEAWGTAPQAWLRGVSLPSVGMGARSCGQSLHWVQEGQSQLGIHLPETATGTDSGSTWEQGKAGFKQQHFGEMRRILRGGSSHLCG